MNLKLGICVLVFSTFALFFLIKYRKKIMGMHQYFKSVYRKKYFYLKQKHYMTIYETIRVILSIGTVVLGIIIVLEFLYAIQVLQYDAMIRRFYIDFSYIDIQEECYGYLWAQISSSLIVSTVVSLLSVFSSTYVYGKKQINVIYNNNSLFSLGKMYIYLMLLNLGSLIICIRKERYYIILINFIVMLYIVSYMLFKIIWFYAHPFFYRNWVKCDYLKREKRHIKKAMPLESYEDEEINNLKIRTMELIQKNDDDYNTNINALMNMIELSLINHLKETQAYYTEMISNRTDFISSVLEIITHLIKYEKETEACNLMARLYSRLVFHRIVLVQDVFSFSIILDLINYGKYIDDERKASEYYSMLWSIVENTIFQVYLYNCEVDFSDCRLAKHELICCRVNNDYMEKLYLSIRENHKLSKVEKERIYIQLYNRVRMMEIEIERPRQDARFLGTIKINQEKIFIPLIIKGEPVVLMFMEMIEKQDVYNLRRYLTMNLSELLMKYIVCVVTASLIRFMNDDCKRVYMDDLSLSKEQIVHVFKEAKLQCKNVFDEAQLKELYIIMKEGYISNREKRPYSFSSRIQISKEILNNYFYVLYEKINKINIFNETIGEKYKKNDKILEIIKELEI